VLDCSSLIPCGEKSKEEKEAIRWLGSALSNPNLIDCTTIYFSSYLLKIYQTKVAPLLKHHHPLPPFQVSLLNLLPTFRKVSTVSRGSLCKTIPSEMGIKFHILEKTRVQSYDVNNIGLTEEDDREVLRIALASRHQKMFLVTTDHHFLENLNRTKLSKRFPNESQKIEIVTPNDPGFKAFLVACIL